MKPVLLLPALGLLLWTPSARGYDFEISAQTIGQGYQLRWIRFSEPDRLLNRNRLTQSLGLDAWNILEPPFDPGRPDQPPLAPFNLYFTSSLRVNHDFGEFTQGDTIYASAPGMTTSEPVTAAVPELGSESFDL